MEYFHNVDLVWLANKLIMPICILVVTLLAGIKLNSRLRQRIAERRQNEDDESKIKNIFFNASQGLPISMCLIIGLYWIVNTADYLPVGLVKIFSYLLFTVVVITITRVVEKTLSGFIKWKMDKSGEASSASSSLLQTVGKIVIYAVSALIILDAVDISIAPIVTAMGVGGMAIAFGVQDIVANVISGFFLIVFKQVQINDFIKLSSGVEGRVTDINFRFTTVTPAADGNIVVIPNKDIAGALMTNYSLPRPDVGIVINMGVAYDSDLEQVERVTLEVARAVQEKWDDYDPNIVGSPLHPAVLYQDFGESSINFWAVLHASVYTKQLKIKHEFIKAVTKRYREEGIEIPFPIRTIVLPEDDNKAAEKIKISKKKG